MRLQEIIKNASSWNSARLFFFIFAISFIFRGVLSLIYILQFGMHAVPYVETYFYYGVLEGMFPLNEQDPTRLYFSFLRLFLPRDGFYFAVLFSGMLFSSVTGPLIFLSSSQIYGKEKGIWCALVYSFMIEPLTMGILLFTHDLLLLPIFLLFLLLAFLFPKGKNLPLKILFFLLLCLCAYLGWKTSPVMFLAMETFILYYTFLFIGSLEKKFGIKNGIQTFSFIFLFVMLFILRFTGILSIPDVIRMITVLFPSYGYEGLLSVFQAGSPDFVPVQLDTLWTRYNVFLLMLPFSICHALRKKDSFSLALLFVSVLNVTLFERSTRILDIAFAFIIVHPFLEWNKNWEKYAYVILLVGVSFALISSISKPPSSLVFLVFFLPVVLFSIFIYLLKKSDVKRFFGTFLFSILAINVVFTYALLSSFTPQATEAEWEAARSIPQEAGTLLVPWASGFFFMSVSGHLTQSHPALIDYFYYDILSMEEEEAYKRIMDAGSSHIFISERELKFYIDPRTNKPFVHMHPYLLSNFKNAGAGEIRKSLAYRLMYDSSSLNHFRVTFEKEDEATGLMVKFFVVQP